MPFQFTCEQCSALFVRERSTKKGRPLRFCSRRCAVEHRHPHLSAIRDSDGVIRIVRTCQQCGTTFISNQRGRRQPLFCSRSCHVAHRCSRPDPIFRSDGSVLIPLDQGKFAIIDAIDADQILPFNWHITSGTGKKYVGRTRLQKEREVATKKLSRKIMLHRQIMGAEGDLLVDHIDGNPLNCRRSNLRFATAKQNAQYTKRTANLSGYIGVRKRSNRKHGDRWEAHISYTLGTFDSPEEAARAYDIEAKKLRGSFAYLNFLDEEEVV